MGLAELFVILMGYSNTTTFNVTALQICTRAAAKLKIIDTSNGETLPTADTNDFMLQLGIAVKETMAAQGVLPWLRAFNTLVLQQNQISYSLGPTSTDNWTLSSGFVSTTLSAAAANGATSITVASITGFSSGMKIGVRLTSGVAFWTTVSGNPSGSTITLSSALTGAAASGNSVYGYTTVADRPQRILDVTRVNTANLSVPVDIISLNQYMQLPNKYQAGTPLQIEVSPTLANTTVRIWQPFDGTSGWETLSMLCDTLMVDVAASADTAYFPVEWANYLIFQLAYEMSFEYPVPKTDRDDLGNMAMRKLQALLDYSSTLAQSPLSVGLRIEQ